MSKFFQLNMSDFVKGLIIAVLTVIVTSVGDIIATGNFPTAAQWKIIGLAALSAAIAYIIKNLLTNSQGQFLTVEPKATVTATKS
jgi:hypothetical protein